MALSNTDTLIKELRQGRLIVLMDDDTPESEGHLLMAAQHVRPDDINFMARQARGLVCLSLTQERCEQLQLPLMVDGNNFQQSSDFTVSIEAVEGVTTGISAADRAVTIQAAMAIDAKPEDLAQPGHVFPLIAQPGGVLRRAGPVEAGCDLTRLAGLTPAAAFAQILDGAGELAKHDALLQFAEQHHLTVGLITDLIRFRIEHEKTVERAADCEMPTRFGDFRLHAYRDTIDGRVHLAMVKGRPTADVPVPVRVHIRDSLGDLTASLRDEHGWPLYDILQRIGESDTGVVVILQPEESPTSLLEHIRQYHRHDEKNAAQSHTAADDLRTFGLGAQILADLGVRKMRVLSAPKKLHGLSGFGLEIVEYLES